MASVEVLQMDRARDPVMATIARKIWLLTAKFNIHFPCQHIAGTVNTTSDLLSRWSNSTSDVAKLHQLVPNPIWMPCHINLTYRYCNYVLCIPRHNGFALSFH